METASTQQQIVVTDIKMPFISMVVFMVKWAVASIPAVLILVALASVFWVLIIGAATSIFSPRPDIANPVLSAKTDSSGGHTKAQEGNQASSAETAYRSEVLVRNVKVAETYLGGSGVFGEVKNAGDYTLTRIEITIYCLGKDGKPVFEKTYTPVLASSHSSDEQPLKPGYGRQFGVKVDDAPSDWVKKVEVKVTDVRFQ